MLRGLPGWDAASVKRAIPPFVGRLGTRIAQLFSGARLQLDLPSVDTLAPLLTPTDIALLAEQARLLTQLPVREVHDHHAGDWTSRWLGRGLDFEESRLYSPGDDTRDMDWRTTARTGRPHLKIYREERQPTVHLVVDRSATMRFGTRRRLKATQAARVAALLAFAASEQNGAIGASVWNGEDETLPARHGRLAALALVERASAPCPPLVDSIPTDALHQIDRLAWLETNLPRGTHLVLISDFAWLDAAVEPVLVRLAERCDVWAIQIIDPAERMLPPMGRVHFHDMGSHQNGWLDTTQTAVREASQLALTRRLDTQAASLACVGIPHLHMGSEVDDLVSLLAHG